MQRRRYAIYDVFTRDVLAGNPLAVVFDCGGLDSAAMQRIAREFNLSETSFVLAPDNPRHKARVRIFTPDYELPFAGHPTVGTAIALAEASLVEGPEIMVLEEGIGPIRCAVSTVEGLSFAEFDLACLPELLSLDVERATVAAALGLAPDEIGFDTHDIALWSAGVAYLTVPVRGLAAARAVAFNNAAWLQLAPVDASGKAASAYVYCRGTGGGFHARMFVPGSPSYEDPATGSAAAAFAGAVVAYDRPSDGTLTVAIEQGIEMGRPSQIRLDIQVEASTIAGARIGGHAVKVAEGTLFV